MLYVTGTITDHYIIFNFSLLLPKTYTKETTHLVSVEQR